VAEVIHKKIRETSVVRGGHLSEHSLVKTTFSDYMIPQTFTVTCIAYPFLLLSFFCYTLFVVVVSVR